MDVDKTWKTAPCTNTYSSICKKSPGQTILLLVLLLKSTADLNAISCLSFRHSSHRAPSTPWKLPGTKEAKNLDTFQRPLLFLSLLNGRQLGPCLSWMSKNGYCMSLRISTSRSWFCVYAADIMLLCLCLSGAALVSIEDPLEGHFIQQNLELLQDSAKNFWIGLYKTHEGEHNLN